MKSFENEDFSQAKNSLKEACVRVPKDFLYDFKFFVGVKINLIIKGTYSKQFSFF